MTETVQSLQLAVVSGVHHFRFRTSKFHYLEIREDTLCEFLRVREISIIDVHMALSLGRACISIISFPKISCSVNKQLSNWKLSTASESDVCSKTHKYKHIDKTASAARQHTWWQISLLNVHMSRGGFRLLTPQNTQLFSIIHQQQERVFLASIHLWPYQHSLCEWVSISGPEPK